MLGRRTAMSEDEAQSVASQTPETMGNYLAAQLSESFRLTPTAVSISDMGTNLADLVDIGKYALGVDGAERPTAIDKSTWEASENYREGIEWDESFSPAKARIYAEDYDDMKARQEILRNKPDGFLSTALGFGAALVGSIPDPVNLIPFGTVIKGGKAAHMIGKAALEGAAGNLATSIATRPYWEKRGDESDWQDYAMDTIMGAAVGTLFGGAGLAVRALRGASSASDRAKIAQGVEARIMGENPANVEGVPEATASARADAGIDGGAQFQPDTQMVGVETFEPPKRTLEDPEGLTSFVTDEDVASVERMIAENPEALTDIERMEFDEVKRYEETADKAAEAYAKAVECLT